MAKQVMSNMNGAFVPMAWLVDTLPMLKYLPSFLPGMAFKRIARQWHILNRKFINVPYLFARQQFESGHFRASYVSNILEDASQENTRRLPASHDIEEDIKWTAATLYAAGSDTAVSSLSSLVLAMVMFPEVQRQAQDEIDKVIGKDRLPCFEDRKKLPYLNAMIKEVYRWAPPNPLGAPHVPQEDVTYDGFCIPKGSFILSSVWWLFHDPLVHEDPDRFDPGRYLAPRNEPDPWTDVFGYGRRVCPGRYLADLTVFITIANILAIFNISKAIDKQGHEIEVTYEPTTSIISHPKTFCYSIAPRSQEHAELVRRIRVDSQWKDSDADHLTGL
jgi:fumagillin biosynthesis cytochrome P450 monooxygenase